jgi:hypothetical protein
LFWLPAVVSKLATTEDGTIMGYAVRMLDNEDTFASSGQEEDNESTVVSTDDVRAVQAPPPSSQYGFEYGSTFKNASEVTVGTLCTAWMPAINQHVRAVVADVSMLLNGPKPSPNKSSSSSDGVSPALSLDWQSLATPRGSVTVKVHKEEEDGESLQQVPLVYLRRRGLMEEEDFKGELIVIEEEEDDDEEEEAEVGRGVEAHEARMSVSPPTNEILRPRINNDYEDEDDEEDDRVRLNFDLGERERSEERGRSVSLVQGDDDEEEEDGNYESDNREEEEEEGEDYVEGDDELFSFEGPMEVMGAIETAEYAEEVAQKALQFQEVIHER